MIISMNKRTKTRATAVVIKGNQTLLIHRRNENEYYVFPGGGVEEGETSECAVLRELKEETSIEVKLVKLLEHMLYDDGRENFSYLCEFISGNPRLADDSPERLEMKKGVQYYDPIWMDIDKLSNMENVYPDTAKRALIQYYTNQKTFN